MASVLKISALLLSLSFAQPEMAYLGAFRVPADFADAGKPIAFNPVRLLRRDEPLAKLLAALQQALK